MKMWSILFLVGLPCITVGEVVSPDCIALSLCDDPIMATPLFAGGDVLLPDVSSVTAIDDVCSKLPDMKTCVSNHLSSCSSEQTRQQHVILKNIIDWMCTPEGRQVTLDLEKSKCKGDPLIGQKLQQVYMSCGTTFQNALIDEMSRKGRLLTPHERCPLQDELAQCVARETNTVCGPEMSLFTEKVWRMSTAATFGDIDCSLDHQISRRYLEAAILIAKRTSPLKNNKRPLNRTFLFVSKLVIHLQKLLKEKA